MLKKRIAPVLAGLLLLGLLGGCSNAEPAPTTEPKETQPEEEKQVLKVLTLGSSSSVDACHMLNMVAAAEGVEQELIVGTLYYSGCTLAQHVQFYNQNSNVYDLYLSSSKTPEKRPQIIKEVSMRSALGYDYWDIIVLQGSSGESLKDESFTNGNIVVIKDFVKELKKNPESVFAWHAIASCSTDPELIASYPYDPNPYQNTAAAYDYDREKMFHERADRLERFILADEDYEYVVASCTAVENAITSGLGQKGIKRDYTHLTDIGRLIAAYSWYCELYGIEELTEIKVDAIPKDFLKTTTDKTVDRVVTEYEKNIIMEAVNNTIKNPLVITQSQYTQAPEA